MLHGNPDFASNLFPSPVDPVLPVELPLVGQTVFALGILVLAVQPPYPHKRASSTQSRHLRLQVGFCAPCFFVQPVALGPWDRQSIQSGRIHVGGDFDNRRLPRWLAFPAETYERTREAGFSISDLHTLVLAPPARNKSTPRNPDHYARRRSGTPVRDRVSLQTKLLSKVVIVWLVLVLMSEEISRFSNAHFKSFVVLPPAHTGSRERKEKREIRLDNERGGWSGVWTVWIDTRAACVRTIVIGKRMRRDTNPEEKGEKN
ncbi:hypothetical protein DL93DRAFT_2097446 [Clavulina sp. PMI_390]|nr:hypothetical protein DL93DRAFT_2097446 [Clavulina sp. PMI_390]